MIEQFSVKDGAVLRHRTSTSYPVHADELTYREIYTKIVATNNPPSGMGEIGVVTVAPAMANAMFPAHGQTVSAAFR